MQQPRRLRTITLGVLTLGSGLFAQDQVHGHLINFHDNGAWSWFEDERAIVDRLRGRILVASCADNSGLGGAARGGDIDVAWLNLAEGRFGNFELRDRLQGDDHNSPALLLRPDGRYLAMFGTHGGSGQAARLSRWRVSTQPGEPTSWTAEKGFLHAASMSYSNLFHLNATGRTYNFVRAVNFDPNVMVSTDQGSTWSGAGKLLTEGGGSDRPYLKYASDGDKRIHVITTERHPRNFENSIYHGYIEKAALHDSFGRVVDSNILDTSGKRPTALTRVFRTGTSFGGTVMRRAWTIDVAVDSGGVVRALFEARAADSASDHRLFFARFDGRVWNVHQVCKLGGGLYSSEQDYTGLGALHPNRPDTIHVSTPIHPGTGRATTNHEIYEGTTTNNGASWTFKPVTENSSVDNLRPIVPSWDSERTALLWLRGTYRTYTNYDLAVVGRIEAPELEIGKLTYYDATTSNTTLTNGSSANPTGPLAGQGATDGRWHLRTGFGNGSYVWTSGEKGYENAPELRTRLTGLTPGLHDVFLMFWSNPNNDWAARAGFSAGALRNFEKRGSAVVDPNNFVVKPVVTGSTVKLYSVWMGRAMVGSNKTLDVFVDDFLPGQAQTERCWYDGIASAPVACRAATQTVGHGCNGTARLSLSANPRIGTTVNLSMVKAKPGEQALLQVGSGALQPIPLTLAGFPGCVLWTDGSLTVALGLISPSGTSTPLSLKIPVDPSLRCVRFGLQGGTIPNGLQLTPALLLLPGS